MQLTDSLSNVFYVILGLAGTGVAITGNINGRLKHAWMTLGIATMARALRHLTAI